MTITPSLVLGRGCTPHLRAPDGRCPLSVEEVELACAAGGIAVAQCLLQIGVHAIDGRNIPVGILRVVGSVVRIDLRHSTCVARTFTTLVALLIARVPLPREVERTPTAVLRTCGVPLQHQLRGEVAPATPVGAFVKLLNPDGLGSPCRSGVPQRGERVVELVDATVQNLLEAVGSELIELLSLGLVLCLSVGTVGQTISLPHVASPR